MIAADFGPRSPLKTTLEDGDYAFSSHPGLIWYKSVRADQVHT
jgi:hypothetical protein